MFLVVNVKQVMTEKCQELALQNLAVPALVIANLIASNIREEYKNQLIHVLTAEQIRTTVFRVALMNSRIGSLRLAKVLNTLLVLKTPGLFYIFIGL